MIDFLYTRSLRVGQITFTAMYDVLALASKNKMSPYLCHPDWEDFRFCGNGNCKATDAKTQLAINYAAHKSLSLIFNDPVSHLILANFMNTNFGISVVSTSMDPETPEGIGNIIAQDSYNDKLNDRSNPTGDMSGSPAVNGANTDWTLYEAVNKPMPTLGQSGDCSLLNRNHHQPLNNSFGPVPWPPAFWGAVRTFAPVVFPVEAPWRHGKNTNAEFNADWQMMLDNYSTLDDVRKTLAHFWATGIEKDYTSTWAWMAQMTLIRDVVEFKGLSYKDGVKIHFYNFNSANDGAIAAIKNKRFHDVMRPTAAMQCTFTGQTITSWKGPYQGVGTMQGENWKAWHPNVNNGSPEYPCEHCVNNGNVAQVLTNFFGTDRYFGRNVTIAEGSFLIEKKITVGNPGYIAGVTDVPNTGPNSVGYAPATDMHLSWSTNQQFSRDCAMSRIMYGVHTYHSGWVGERTGFEVANRCWKIVTSLFEGNRECKVIGAEL
jgi:hypothetical protein